MDSKCQSPLLMKPTPSDVWNAAANDEAQLGEGREGEGNKAPVRWLQHGAGQREHTLVLMKLAFFDVCQTTANDQLGEAKRERGTWKGDVDGETCV